MKVTVLIANHNYGHYLNDAINSVLAQTYQPIQLCIVDDGSTDNSWNIIEQRLFVNNEVNKQIVQGILIKQSLIGQNKFMAIKSPKAGGPSSARNLGIEATKQDTDVYAILDADDILLPTKIEKCVNKLRLYPELGLVYADYDIINVHTGNVLREYKWPYSKRKLYQECIIHSGAVVRKQAFLDVVESTGYYDNRLRCAEDYDCWLRISEKYPIAHIPEVLTLVRTHNQNSTESVNKDVWNTCWQLVSEKVKLRNGFNTK